ncbi:hypothetical protein N7493_004888 [Penicillium malachiteum]|uniref:Thioesterase domain-containing protein n=1 Tax=Penicillium malachiteum TaxID=1324776 RepID=A0AAD6HLM3_9EURO|nr:hypothetical protein N7493_004888 [Penicillium malachiteum]
MYPTNAEIESIFGELSKVPSGCIAFLNHVDDGVKWEITGQNSLSGHWTSKSEFMNTVWLPIIKLIAEPGPILEIASPERMMRNEDGWVAIELKTKDTRTKTPIMPSISPLAIQTFIEDHPMVQGLRQSGKFIEYRGYGDYPHHLRERNLCRPSHWPGNDTHPTICICRSGWGNLIEILYFGGHVSGYPGIVHGGLLATILDEGLGWCCFPSLPGGAGATVTLDVRYLSPLPTDSFAVLKAETKDVVGRKEWVEGHIDTLPENGEPTVVAEARALFVAPRNGNPPGV